MTNYCTHSINKRVSQIHHHMCASKDTIFKTTKGDNDKPDLCI